MDGAFLGSREVIELATLPPRERTQWLAACRCERKDDACSAVEGYMATLQVSLDELIRYRAKVAEAYRRQSASVLDRAAPRPVQSGRRDVASASATSTAKK